MLSVKVMYPGGVLKTLPVIDSSLSISMNVNGVSTCNFQVDDISGSYNEILDGCRVFVYDSITLIFTGFVLSSEESEFLNVSRYIDVDCVDNTDALKADLTGQVTFENVSVNDLVNYVVSRMESEFNNVNVYTSEVIESIDFAYETGFDALNKIIELIDGVWYIDALMNIFVYDKSGLPRGRAIGVSDIEGRPSVSYDGSDYINKVVFSNFYRPGSALTEVLVGDDSAKSFNLKNKVYSITSITRMVTDGSNVRSQTFDKISDETDMSLKDWYFEVNSEVLYQSENPSALPLYDTEKLIVTYVPLFKRSLTVRDDSEMNSYFARNGVIRGKATLCDEFVVGNANANAVATRLINARKLSNTSITLTTSVRGYKPGQIVRLDLGSIGIDSVDFYIKSISVQADGDNITYTLSCNRGFLIGSWTDAFGSKSTSYSGSGRAGSGKKASSGGVVLGDTGLGSGGGFGVVAEKIYERDGNGDVVGQVDIYFTRR